MMRAIVGSNNPTTVRIGYGKPTSATSDGLGTKNGTRLEDHGCLYVKTSLNF
jgi:hypothetical protein